MTIVHRLLAWWCWVWAREALPALEVALPAPRASFFRWLFAKDSLQ